MKKDSAQQKRPATGGQAITAARRTAQRGPKQGPAAEGTPANVEESPHMDRGDSAGGSGESLRDGRDPGKAAEERLPNGAVDTQYGTDSSIKTGRTSGQGGRVSSAGSGSSGAGADPQRDIKPASPDDSAGAERDTMTGSRPGSRS
jgi:hypothetical protein